MGFRKKKFICYAPPRNMSVGLLKEADLASKIAFLQAREFGMIANDFLGV